MRPEDQACSDMCRVLNIIWFERVLRRALVFGGVQHALHAAQRGRAVQLDPIKPKLKPPGNERLKLNRDILLSNFAFKLNLRRYNVCYKKFQYVSLNAFHPTKVGGAAA